MIFMNSTAYLMLLRCHQWNMSVLWKTKNSYTNCESDKKNISSKTNTHTRRQTNIQADKQTNRGWDKHEMLKRGKQHAQYMI